MLLPVATLLVAEQHSVLTPCLRKEGCQDVVLAGGVHAWELEEYTASGQCQDRPCVSAVHVACLAHAGCVALASQKGKGLPDVFSGGTNGEVLLWRS